MVRVAIGKVIPKAKRCTSKNCCRKIGSFALPDTREVAGEKIGLHGVWINGARVTDAQGFCADPKSRPGAVLRSFAA